MNCKINFSVLKWYNVVIWCDEKEIKNHDEIQKHDRRNCAVKLRSEWFLKLRSNVKQRFLLT